MTGTQFNNVGRDYLVNYYPDSAAPTVQSGVPVANNRDPNPGVVINDPLAHQRGSEGSSAPPRPHTDTRGGQPGMDNHHQNPATTGQFGVVANDQDLTRA